MSVSRRLWCCVGLLILVVLAVTVTLVVLLRRDSGCEGGFLHGAVAADSAVCSDIGRDILQLGGSPVDGAIAALLCSSVINPQSMGLGGGVIFTIYNATTGQVEIINARESVPASVPDLAQCETPDFLRPGVQWIGVPGELRGYEAAHQRHGRLPWKSLFEPTIKLVTEGVRIPPVLGKFLAINIVQGGLLKSSLCQLFCKGGKVLRTGDALNLTQLGHTLRTVAEEGVDSFYQGSIARQMLQDLGAQGSNLSLDDLRNYQVQIVDALNVSLGSHTLYTAPPPAGGALLSFILNILEGYHFSAASVRNEEAQTQTYHRIAEALKFANGQRVKLRHPWTGNMRQITDSLLSKSFAQQIRQRIDGSGNHSLGYYNVTAPHLETTGTTHLSVISQDGSSVSVTSTINHVFGSMVYSPHTGIIFNNELADFCSDRPRNIKAGDRPPSAMTPSILLSHDKKSQLVIGGAGGNMITSATAQAIMNALWFGSSLGKSISDPILYVTPENTLSFESSFNKAVQRGLQEMGHQPKNNPYFFNVVQGVSQEGACLRGHSDVRKMARAAGY